MRRAARTRAVALAAAVGLLLAACSGEDGADGADRGAEGAGDGGAAGRPPLDVERVDEAVFRSEGASGSLVAAATNADGVAVAVGSVVDPATGDIGPLAIESTDGVTWSRTEVPSPGSHAGITAVAALPDGAFVAVGTVTTDDGVDGVVWRRDAGGGWGDATVPEAFGSAGAEGPATVAAGRAGILVAGRLDDRPAAWTSTDGETWALVDGPFGDLFSIDAVVVGDRFVVMGLDLEPTSRSAVHVFTSLDGAEFGETATLGEPGLVEVNDAAFVGGRYVAVGGRRPEPSGNLAPRVWVSPDAHSWTAGPALDHDAELATNNGVEADAIVVAPSLVAVSSTSGHRVWTSPDAGASFAVAASSIPDQLGGSRLPLAVPAGNPTLVGDDELFGLLAGGDWQERAPGLVPRPRTALGVADVAPGPDGFVAVGSATTDDPGDDDGRATQGVVWRSQDGSDWRRVRDDRDLAGSRLEAVAAYAAGYVAVGVGDDGALDRTARVFVSPDGDDWAPVDGDGLAPPPGSGGTHQLESVAAHGEGFVAAGWSYDGTDVVPLVLVSDGATLRRADLGPPAPGRDLITLGVCVQGTATTVVGVDQADEVHAASWSSADGARWRQRPSAENVSRLYDCAVRDDGTMLAVGDMFEPREDGAVAAIDAAAPDAGVVVDPLPGGEVTGQRAEAVTWIGDHPLVVGSAADDPQRGAVIWWGPDGADETDEAGTDGAGGWQRLAGDVLGGPGQQAATGVASDGDTVVVVGTAAQGGAVWRAPLPPP